MRNSLHEDVKDYLGQIQTLEEEIYQKYDELEEMRQWAILTGAIRYDKDKVISSPVGDRMSAQVARIVDFEKAILDDVERYMLKKDGIINQIHSLKDYRQVKILYLKFVEYMELKDIAVEVSYSYEHTRHLYINALEAFGRKYKNVF